MADHWRTPLMERFSLIAAGFIVGAIAMFACSPRSPSPDERTVHFHGKFDALHFCDGDDGELIGEGGMLTIECADRRRTLVAVTGSNTTLSHWIFHDSAWSGYSLRVYGDSTTIRESRAP